MEILKCPWVMFNKSQWGAKTLPTASNSIPTSYNPDYTLRKKKYLNRKEFKHHVLRGHELVDINISRLPYPCIDIFLGGGRTILTNIVMNMIFTFQRMIINEELNLTSISTSTHYMQNIQCQEFNSCTWPVDVNSTTKFVSVVSYGIQFCVPYVLQSKFKDTLKQKTLKNSLDYKKVQESRKA